MLARPLKEFPKIIVELEQLVPTNHGPLPYLWATDGKTPAFREAVAEDPHVEQITKVATFEEGTLYGMEWESGRRAAGSSAGSIFRPGAFSSHTFQTRSRR